MTYKHRAWNTLNVAAAVALLITPAQASDGSAPVVRNPATAPDGCRTVTPRLLWRIEGGPDRELFGFLSDVAVDAQGRSYFLDVQLSEVRAYSRDGLFLKTLFREGEGPGEFSHGMGCAVLADGRVAVQQIMPATIVTADPESGDPGPNLPLPWTRGAGLGFIQQFAPLGSGLVMSWVSAIVRDGAEVNDRVLAILEADGRERARVLQQSVKLDEARRSAPLDREDSILRGWRVGCDSLLYVAPHHLEYRVYSYDDRGRLRRIIERDHEPLARSAGELEAVRRRYAAQGLPVPARDLDPLHRTVQEIVARDDGELWILSSRGRFGQPPGCIGVFDVFDAAGRLQRQVDLRAEYVAEHDVWAIVGDRLYVFQEGRHVPRGTSSGSGGSVVMLGSPDTSDRSNPPPFVVRVYELPLSKEAAR